ncbi:MAG: HDIG domain-containing protein [Planctomycetota bacterium]
MPLLTKNRKKKPARFGALGRSVKTGLTEEKPRLQHVPEKVLMGVIFTLLEVLFLLPSGASGLQVLGAFVLIVTLNYFVARYLVAFHRPLLSSRRRLAGALTVAALLLLVGEAAPSFAESIGPQLVGLVVPLSLVALVLRIACGPRLGIEASAYLAALLGLQGMTNGASPVGPFSPWQCNVLLFLGASVGCLSLGRIRRRMEPLRVGVVIGLTHLILYIGLRLLDGANFLGPGNVQDLEVSLALVFHGLLVGFVVSGTLPLIELAFDVMTDMTLLELSNQNEHPLLRRLLIEAPGTYHHSFIVANLSESAAAAIGADPLLTRVGAYFHDIGKMNKPEYFAENAPDARDRHEKIPPEMSALIISAHVKDGLEMAEYYDLPRPLRDFIPMHHGTTCIEYFYHEALQEGRPHMQIEQHAFRYQGPRPNTRETAIVMMADSVEAASRSLSDPTPARIEKIVHDIMMKKLMDGQLDDCPLTLRDLTRIEDRFCQVLLGIYHTRPRYPGQKE